MKSEQPEWAWAQRMLETAFGHNPFGGSVYRFAWSSDRLHRVGGKFEDRDDKGALIREVVELRQIPKYSHLEVGAEGQHSPHWIVERWYPAEHFGSRAQWDAKTIEIEGRRNVPALGPYPEKGDYEYSFILEGPIGPSGCGDFRQLTMGRVEWVIGILRDAEERTAKQRALLTKTAREVAKKIQHELDLELLNEATPAFKGKLRRGSAAAVPGLRDAILIDN